MSAAAQGKAKAAHAAHDARIARILPTLVARHGIACLGCATPFCCYEIVAASEDEAEHATQAALAAGIDVAAHAAVWKASAQTVYADGPSPDPVAYFAARIACPLLGADGRCLVYEARPLACRSHFVAGDPAACALRHASRSNERVVHVESRAAGLALLGDGPTANFAYLFACYVRTLAPAARLSAEP